MREKWDECWTCKTTGPRTNGNRCHHLHPIIELMITLSFSKTDGAWRIQDWNFWMRSFHRMTTSIRANRRVTSLEENRWTRLTCQSWLNCLGEGSTWYTCEVSSSDCACQPAHVDGCSSKTSDPSKYIVYTYVHSKTQHWCLMIPYSYTYVFYVSCIPPPAS